MFSLNFILTIIGIFSGIYAISYGIYELKQKNTASATTVFVVAIAGILLSVIQNFN